MPRDNDKNNDSRGRRDRLGAPAARAAPAPPGGRRRSLPSGALPARARAPSARASGGPMRANPTAPNPSARSPMPESATAMRRVRAATGVGDRPPRRRLAMSRVRVATSRSSDRPPRGGDEKRPFKPRGDRPNVSTRDDRGGEKRPYTPRGDRPNFNRDDRPPRVTPVRPRASPTRSSATRNLTRRATAMARSGPTRRVAKAFARTATGRRAIARIAHGRRAMATGPARKFDRPERKFGGEQEVFARRAGPWPAQGFWRPSAARRFQAVAEARGWRPRGTPSAAPGVSTSRVSTSRATIAAATSVRAFRARARIVRQGDRPRGDRPERPRFDRPRRRSSEIRSAPAR